MTRTLRKLLVVLAAAATLATACSSDEDGSTDAGSSESESSSATASASESESASASASEPADEADEAPEEATEEAEAAEPVEETATTSTTEAPPPSVFPLTITDATGREFTFDEPPVLGCRWFGCIEGAAHLGVTVPITGATPDREEQAFYSTGAETFVADTLNPEEWATTDVDVILASVLGAGTPNFAPLENNFDVFFLHYDSGNGAQPNSLSGTDAYLENLRLISLLADQPDLGDQAIADYEAMLETLRSLSTPETEAQTLTVLFGFEGYVGLGPESAFCLLLNETGHGTCIGEGPGGAFNAEAFLADDPDLIVATSFGGDYSIEDRESNDPIWNELSAVQNGNVVTTDSSRFYCCSASALVLMAQEYVSLVLPETGIEKPDEDTFTPATSPLVTG